MKPSQINDTHVNSGLTNQFKSTSLVHKEHESNWNNADHKDTKIGIAYSYFLLKFVIVAAIIAGVMMTSSCQRETTTYLYRVQFVTSGAKTVVVDVEKGVQTYGSYSKGDTVHVTRRDSITSDGRYRKAVIIDILGQQ